MDCSCIREFQSNPSGNSVHIAQDRREKIVAHIKYEYFVRTNVYQYFQQTKIDTYVSEVHNNT